MTIDLKVIKRKSGKLLSIFFRTLPAAFLVSAVVILHETLLSIMGVKPPEFTSWWEWLDFAWKVAVPLAGFSTLLAYVIDALHEKYHEKGRKK